MSLIGRWSIVLVYDWTTGCSGWFHLDGRVEYLSLIGQWGVMLDCDSRRGCRGRFLANGEE